MTQITLYDHRGDLITLPPPEQRSDITDRDSWFADLITGPSSVTGQRVNQQTAMGLSAYFAAIRNIAEDVAKLPIKVFRQLQPRGKSELRTHPVYKLLHDQANPRMSAFTFRETLTSHALAWHGGYAEIQRMGDGRPSALWPLDPRSITPIDDEPNGQVLYRVIRDNGSQVILSSDQVFVIHGLGMDGITGYVMTQIGKDSFGSAIGAQRFSGAYFSNGANPSGILEVPGAMKDAALARLRKSFAERYQGAANSGKPIILENGTKWNSIGATPEDSQMLESMQFNVDDVARWFRIPPHKIGSLNRATFSNIEQQGIDYVTDTLMSWLVRWEQEIRIKLLLKGEREQVGVEHVTEALMRGDSSAQAQFFREMNQIGVMSANDIRDKLNMNPIPGGDQYVVNGAMTLLEDVGKEPEPVVPPQPDIPDEDDEDQEDQDDDQDDNLRSIQHITETHRQLLEASFVRLINSESTRINRKRNKPNYRSWATQWVEEHPAWIITTIGTAMDAMASAMRPLICPQSDDDDVTAVSHSVTRAIAARHMEDMVLPMLACKVDSPVDESAYTMSQESVNAMCLAMQELRNHYDANTHTS